MQVFWKQICHKSCTNDGLRNLLFSLQTWISINWPWIFKIISDNELMRGNAYTHWKLLSEMEFGVWKYMFSNAVYALMGQKLLRIFPNKPLSSRQQQYDNSYIFQELDYINKLRNRIAHHEPICFNQSSVAIDTSYALNQYARMMRLFQWMDIDGVSLMFGLDHVGDACSKIMCL